MTIAHSAIGAGIWASVAARKERLRRYPGSAYRWLPNQMAFRRSTAKVRMIRQGNQWGGKSTVALDEVLLFMRGAHPDKPVPMAPVEWWVICAESSQSIAIQRKMWDLVDPDEVHAECKFDEARGFRGRNPVLRFKSGSICRFKTTGQKTITLAGATIDGVLFDEPPTSVRLFTEIQKRVMNRGGTVLIAMTPVNAGPLDWLQELADSGVIEDHHARMTAKAMIPVGETEPIQLADGTVCDQAWVDAQLAATPEHERDVVCHGEWQNRTVERVFMAFTPALVTAVGPKVRPEVRLGIDYGDKVGKQYGVLLFLIRGQHNDEDEVWAWDETPETENSTETDDAKAILAMLGRNGLTWDKLTEATGDRAYERGAIKKGNLGLQRMIARIMRKPSDAVKPQIRTAKMLRDTGRRSVDQGVRYLHRLMVAGRFHVHPRCVRLIEALNRWDGRQAQNRTGAGGLVFVDSYYKDPIDGVRYGLESRVFASGLQRGTVAAVRTG